MPVTSFRCVAYAVSGPFNRRERLPRKGGRILPPAGEGGRTGADRANAPPGFRVARSQCDRNHMNTEPAAVNQAARLAAIKLPRYTRPVRRKYQVASSSRTMNSGM